MPALFTRTVTGPKRSSASATAAIHSSSDGHVEVAVGGGVAEVGGDGRALVVEHVGEQHRRPLGDEAAGLRLALAAAAPVTMATLPSSRPITASPADDPHGEELRAAAVGVPDGRAGTVDLVLAAMAADLQGASAKRSMPLTRRSGSTTARRRDMFTGRSPSSWVTPSSTIFQPSPLGANPRFSSHIGSNQENGTYISTQSTSATDP